MSLTNHIVLYVTDASQSEIQALYRGLEGKGFHVDSMKTDVPGYAYGPIRTSVNRRETVKEGFMVIARKEGNIDTPELSDIIKAALPESVDVRAFRGNLEYRTQEKKETKRKR